MLIQVVAATGQTIYVFIWNAAGKIWNTQSAAFETYNVMNWAHYAIAATEQAGSGSYFATIPTGITTAGNYTWAGYIQLGGSPASGDTPVAQGPFAIPPSQAAIVVPTTLLALIAIVRSLVGDTPTKKIIQSEQLGGSDLPQFPVDGTNTTFQLKNAPLSDDIGMAIYSWVTIVGTGAVVRSQAIFTIVDPINGIINFTDAPNPGSATPAAGVYVAYNYEWFTDSDYAQFLYQAAQMTLAGTIDPTTIVNGLSDAMVQYAIAQFWLARASQYAERYASSAGGVTEQVQAVAQIYLNLAKAANTRADFLKLDFYKRQGQREAPASADITHRWDKISPIR